MRARQALFVALLLFGSPSIGAAGPIEFQLMPTSLWTEPGNPAIATGLVLLTLPSTIYTYDPASEVPTAVEVVAFDPSLLPPPPANPSGVPHWNNAGPFRVYLHLTDTESGESADFYLMGHIHMINTPGNSKWEGEIEFRFLDSTEVMLGNHTYAIWGINDRDAGPATIHITVEPNSPAHAPEPGTLLLGALGLAPLAVLRLRWRASQ